MGITLYMTPLSPPARAVLMVAEALGIKLNIKNVDLKNGEHLTPAYRKLNPQHTVPMIDDDGTIIWDSHAIIAYLVGKYGKDDSLYPKDLVKRALVDQRMYFEATVSFFNIRLIVRPMVYQGQKTIPQESIQNVEEGYEMLDQFLIGNKWAAGNSVTIADLSLVSSITSSDVMIPIDKVKYPNLARWLSDVCKLPYYKVNVDGLEQFKGFIKGLMS